jgi:hypothetical protein
LQVEPEKKSEFGNDQCIKTMYFNIY